jgi:ubiquitin-protein ligase
MQATFADTFKLEFQRPNILYWVGTVEINLKDLEQRVHILKITYPKEYPNFPPEAYVDYPAIYSPKHQFEDGQLCLYNPRDGIAYGWNPATSTAVTVAGWAIEWLYSYYTWKATGLWPGVEEKLHEDPPRHQPPRRRR